MKVILQLPLVIQTLQIHLILLMILILTQLLQDQAVHQDQEERRRLVRLRQRKIEDKERKVIDIDEMTKMLRK